MPKIPSPNDLETVEEYLTRIELTLISRIDTIGIETISKDRAPGRGINLKANMALLNKIRPDKTQVEHTGKIKLDAINIVHKD